VFYTRPNLPRLGLDLADISGGGSCPSQFWGRTVDGRPVYIRYRGGHFSVEAGEIGADEGSPREVLLEADFGPPLHGDLLLEQACDLAGLTVRGQPLLLSEEQFRAAAEHSRILDWSGRTTYWVRDLLVTEQGGRKFVDALASGFPDFVVLGLWWERASSGNWRRRCRPYDEALSQCPFGLALAFGADRARIGALVATEPESTIDLQGMFAHSVSFEFRWNTAPVEVTLPPFFKTLGRPVTMDDFRWWGRLSLAFKTEEPKDKAFVEKVVDLADVWFSNQVENVDLLTGEAGDIRTMHRWHSVDLQTWSRAAPDRYIGFTSKKTGDVVRYFGLRPAITTRE
jgi:hypothetical protein